MARNGDGKIKMTKWRLASGNELSVTYDSEQDRILYAELDWDFKPGSVDSGIAGLRFGASTLEHVRKKFNSNGFSYVKHMMFQTENGLVTFNAFELKRTPSIVVVFVSLLRNTSSLGPHPSDKRLSNEIGKLFTLVAAVVADESYLDEIWGNNKIYDPTSTPIKLWSWYDDA